MMAGRKTSAGSPLPVAPQATLTSRVYAQLKRSILSGHIEPGAKLRVQALRKTFDSGASPIREALNRLLSEGLVEQEAQRGFRTARLSAGDLQELTRTRHIINEICLRESLTAGDVHWEERLVLAFHRMTRVPEFLPDGGLNPVWEQCHRAFHVATIDACPSKYLRQFCESLFDQAERYRYLSAPLRQRSPRNLATHRDILDAAVDRDIPTTVSLVNQHIQALADRILHKLASQEATPLPDCAHSEREPGKGTLELPTSRSPT